eukprot:CAMPEP_0184858862 /NCGR_PEP_ID=MMETSP0580-20130426/3896_1 /TAXON_ID=1118495 /ORGANISM="Dactyliosolen fragilissimus" /LENGTH=631 /DNA_ID=CAMNT_0027355195 /DNA_START=26 /DNA_END=1921 /DNA_ORIENTATION=+
MSSKTSSSRTEADKRRLLSESSTRSLLRERDAQITALQNEVALLTNRLATLNREYTVARNVKTNNLMNNSEAHSTPKRKHKLTPYGNLVRESLSKTSSGRANLTHERAKMGRNASISTARELSALSTEHEDAAQASNQRLANRILEMFKDPASHVGYLKSKDFATDILKLNNKVRQIFEVEPRVCFLQSPAYVFGDIHGNLEDLHFFSDNIWRLGMQLTAGNFVFLGDYVDRGMNCLEVVAYLFAMKLLIPEKVFLLRGNHETRDVNGWEEHYGERSFIYQCRHRFGDDLGFQIWESTNQVFDRLPLAAVIDQDIFCVHGGIPRSIKKSNNANCVNRIQDILKVPKIAGINPPYEHEYDKYQQVASDCIWSDPASELQEQTTVNPNNGFGESLRGGGAICFGQKAVQDFLAEHNFSYIMRAHEAHADGVAVSKGGKVFTIFSTSKDHNQGNEAMAGCILVDFEKMQVINRSPAYKNQYIHRRDSTSLNKLSESEIQQRLHVGLVTECPPTYDDHDAEEEIWGDYDDEVDEQDFHDARDDNMIQIDSDSKDFSLSDRKSSVDPIQTMASPPGSEHGHDETSRDTSASQLIDFSNVETGNRKMKREIKRFSIITEESGGDDDDSTINDEDMDC